ncbi:MAG: hypothetical protein JXR05_01780 [Flavobacteriaceae bacterium]
MFIYIISGAFLYILCSTLLFVMGNYVANTKTPWYQSIWRFNNGLYILFQVLIFIEWYKHFRNKKEPFEIGV